ncbi:D-alanyl-D-alanine carboxypeptidase family protein [Anaerovorax odorimutans]|uniref:D-alanyl-D-alanine carboxypeptidase family protein n=1 Tax=Anaerovorax odorimutans TaxID=109327 RepID=UPI000421A1F4|nr:serine hydrolase [Anaerovorax odorimutans]
MLYYKKIALILVLVMVITMIPMSVIADEKLVDTVDSKAKSETETTGMSVDAKAAVLMDAGSGKVIFEQNAHDKLPPASVTKIMTMLLILEAVDRGQISLDDKVTVSERAAGMGGSQMYMEAGEQQTLETLMQGVAICSANEEHR